jgi:hypothetical protein
MKRDKVMWIFAGTWLAVNLVSVSISPFLMISSNALFLGIGFFWLLPNKHKWQ